MEQPDRVAAPADRRDQQVGQAADAAEHLRAGFLADHALEIADQFGIGVRAGGGADDVEGVMDVGDPIAQRLVHRVFQRRRAGGDRDHGRAEQLHPEHVGCLPRHIGRAHEDRAGQAEPRADRGGGDAVLARAGLGDDPGLAHPDREQDLADAIVDLVRAGVVEFVAFEPDLCAAQLFGEPGRKVQRAGAADVVFQQVVELGLKRRIGLGGGIFRLQRQAPTASAFQRHSARQTGRNGRVRRAGCERNLAAAVMATRLAERVRSVQCSKGRSKVVAATFCA